ncbi:sulfite reductase (NADPH) flavoprotein alpha-component [Paenibacillus cellulosilyticus]|uniref:assimilatory sulfite reductase (NADPH) n=1 Tax=Paenibacillus cellulosilyticus TaxID=375489 RepID=A0A2V2YRH5_9BACL|nr:assimilatory sulfite reductase (NADPH) flavoprotein subunit [Paenibacillus cellulosilyticus]PWV99775.1 sulfite reductase (NADPH) flavoprotein alpha-component [Paenibacillus cellulosilyticus]QKS46488.1 assimilatory sulfite reductase (NADPH) flavoprotein subunit [Paenibacillus cellulosilyticus]
MQLQVTNSPFTSEQAELINKLLPTLTEAQINWLSGFLTFYRAGNAGGAAAQIASAVAFEAPAAVVEAPAAPQLPREATILFGSQTGNSQRLAGRLAEKLKGQGFDVTLSAMNQYKTNKLKEVPYLFIVASTHGEGDPPDNALTFHEFLLGKRAPKLEGTKFAVLALGDTSYEFFCKTGQDFDVRLAELGAERIVDRVDCDVDFEDAAAGWLSAVEGAVSAAAASAAPAASGTASAAAPTAAVESEYTRANPFMAEVLDNLNLNGRGSDRETRHLELSLEGSGLTYAPGDAVGVYPQNDPALVDDIIAELKFNADEAVVTGKAGETSSLRSALLHHFEITVLTKPLLEKAVAFSGNSKLAELVNNKEELKAYMNGRDLLDLLRDFAPWTLKAADIANLLRKLPPRLYSIASSVEAHPEEVHLTIRKVEYEAHGRERKGVCSVYTSERLQPGDKLPIFIQQNPNFKPPVNPDTPVIMVGPGTGVAPFRAFLEDREESGAQGQTWLFYGDRHFVTDFLYQTDWQRMLKDGVLTKLDVAFSRDSKEKVYVQQRMLENGAQLYQWLENGAHVYVCGDEKHMAHDVHKALLSIIEQHGGKSADEAAAYVSALQEQGRYQRDVY